MRRWAYLAVWIAVLTAIDQGTAGWARHALAEGHAVAIGSGVSLQLLFNKGAMLGMGSQVPGVITAVGVAGTIVLVVLSLRIPRLAWPLATMAGGALGNVLSRLIWHRVTDFIHVNGYPGIFNLSDVALRVGATWLIVALVWDEIRQRRAGGLASARAREGE